MSLRDLGAAVAAVLAEDFDRAGSMTSAASI